jgi:hypothetical protein
VSALQMCNTTAVPNYVITAARQYAVTGQEDSSQEAWAAYNCRIVNMCMLT